MRMSRLVSVGILGALLSGSLFAGSLRPVSDTNTFCQSFTVSKKGQPNIPVYVSQEGSFFAQKGWKVDLGGEATVDGLQVKTLGQKLFKTEMIRRVGPVRMQFKRKTYAVELRVTANEEIGRKIMGCMMTPVKELQELVFCFEDTSIPFSAPAAE